MQTAHSVKKNGFHRPRPRTGTRTTTHGLFLLFTVLKKKEK
jgi:hypothetical protein